MKERVNQRGRGERGIVLKSACNKVTPLEGGVRALNRLAKCELGDGRRRRETVECSETDKLVKRSSASVSSTIVRSPTSASGEPQNERRVSDD